MPAPKDNKAKESKTDKKKESSNSKNKASSKALGNASSKTKISSKQKQSSVEKSTNKTTNKTKIKNTKSSALKQTKPKEKSNSTVNKNFNDNSGQPNPQKEGLTLKKQFKKLWSLIKQFFRLDIVKLFLLGIFLLITIPVIFFFINRPKVQHDINYGITFSNKYSEELGLDWKETYIKILDDLGAKNLRLVAYWDDIESTNDRFDFSDLRWQLAEAEKRDVNVILVVGRKVPRWPECFEPQWWKELQSQELRSIELYEYVEQAAIALKDYDSIKMWQVENEPFFPFGICDPIYKDDILREIDIVRKVDDKERPILVQDSGEGGFWYPSYQMGDYLGISMYRKIWYDFWKVLLGRSIYFQYPLAHWTYKIKADLLRVPYQKIIVTELQAEPWGPGPNHTLSDEETNKSMSRNDFLSTISYAQKAGFKDLYLWGAEWWLWQKEVNNNPFYWDTAKALFN